MTKKYDLVIKNGQVYTPNGLEKTEIGILDGKFAGFGDGLSGEKVFDAAGLTVLPGVMDTQVHFREPGYTHKEEILTGTKSAALGGITAIFEMPNTDPLTLTPEDHAFKCARAAEGWTDYAFFIGGSAVNAAKLHELENLEGCPGVKIFMGSSTGNLLVEDEEVLRQILAHGRKRVTAHAEDEAMLRERKHIAEEAAHPRAHPVWRNEETALKAVQRLVTVARQYRRPVHVLHVTSAEEMEYLKNQRDIATVEVLANHLTLHAPDCYETLGTRAQQNPPIRDRRHQDALWRAVNNGLVDILATDHAPHTLEEKDKPYPSSPSGTPGVQTFVPVMLDHVNQGRLTLQRFVDLTSAGPQRVFNIAGKGRIALGYDADLTIVDMKAEKTIEKQWIASKCGWTPFEGRKVSAWPQATIIRGHIVMREDELIAKPGAQAVLFQ